VRYPSALEATQGQILSQISHRCHPILVAFVWELTKETIHFPLGCLQGGSRQATSGADREGLRLPAFGHIPRLRIMQPLWLAPAHPHHVSEKPRPE